MQHPDPDELTLLALAPEQADPAVAEHLGSCEHCRSEYDATVRTVSLARGPDGASDEPLPDPPGHVWDAITRELGTELQPSGPTGPAATARRGRTAVTAARRRRWVVPAVAAAALAVGLLGGLGLGRVLDGPDPGPSAAAIPLRSLDPAATGSATLAAGPSGTEVLVEVQDQGVRGGYLEAWMVDDAGTGLFPLGGLTSDGAGHFSGSFVLPADLPADRYRTVDVSAERFDGDPSHSGESLLRGEVS